VSPVKYELGFYIPEDGILLSHRREELKSYMKDAPIFLVPSAYVSLKRFICSACFNLKETRPFSCTVYFSILRNSCKKQIQSEGP
jgi:hypothetical protein